MKCGVMRSFGLMKKRHQQFVAAGRKLKDASKYANTIEECLMQEADSKRPLDVFPPGELHLLMGAINKKVDIIIKKYGITFLEGWMRQFGIIRRGYNGGGFDGKNSKKVLENVDSLAQYLPNECSPIIEALRAFKEVVSGAYAKKKERKSE